MKHDQKALEIEKKVLGEEHQNTALCYNNIALDLSHLKRYEEALEYSQKAFRISCKVYKQRNPDEDVCLKNLTFYLNRQSDFAHCQKVKGEMLPLCIEKFGKDDPLTMALRKSCSR